MAAPPSPPLKVQSGISVVGACMRKYVGCRLFVGLNPYAATK